LSGKISAFAPILQLRNEAEFTLGLDQQHTFDDIKKYLSSPSVMKATMAGIPFWLYIIVLCFDANNGGQGTHRYILKLVPHRCQNKVLFH
jgi:hypothetical protein